MNHLEICQHYFPNLNWIGMSDYQENTGYYTGTIEGLDYMAGVFIMPQGCQARLVGYGTTMFVTNENTELGLTIEEVLEELRSQWRKFAELNITATNKD